MKTNVLDLEKSLKTIFLNVYAEQLNNASPLFAMIKRSPSKVLGKDIRYYVGDEEILTPLKNMCGKIEIGEKEVNTYHIPSMVVNYLCAMSENSLTSAKDSIQKSLWVNSNEDDIYSIPYLLEQQNQKAVIVKGTGSILKQMNDTLLNKIYENDTHNPNIIIMSLELRRAFINELNDKKLSVDYILIDGGYKAISFHGIPVIADKYLDTNKIYFLNTDDFELQQLCDWRWIEKDDGCILRLNTYKHTYEATLVKYANLICTKPTKQYILEFTEDTK